MMTSTVAHDNFAERLRFWRASQNFTQAEAAKELGVDRSYLSQLERGKTPGTSLLTRFLVLERSLAVNGRGGLPANSAYGLRRLPVLSWAQAEATINSKDIPTDWEEMVASDIADERAFGVRLRGDSMEPRLSDGDIAILLPGSAPTNGETVVANLKDEGMLCKIMHVQLDQNLIKLSSYNPAYPPMERRRDQFHWIFPVTMVTRQLRRK